jgi:hypothetical protein
MPGLIVLARLMPFKYVPFAEEGFALIIAFSNSWLFSAIFSGVKLTLPIDA